MDNSTEPVNTKILPVKSVILTDLARWSSGKLREVVPLLESYELPASKLTRALAELAIGIAEGLVASIAGGSQQAPLRAPDIHHTGCVNSVPF